MQSSGLMNLNDSMVNAAYARYMQLKQSGMQDPQIYQLMDQEKTMIPLGQLAAKLMAVKNAAQQTPMPPQNTINDQLDQQLQQMQNPQQQGIGALPQNAVPAAPGQAPQAAPQGQPQQPQQPQAPQGVAALPAPNVGTPGAYAAGGIVAFNDGGDVKHFDGMSGSDVHAPTMFTFDNGMTASMPYEDVDPDREEYEKLKELFESDIPSVASKHVPINSSNFGSEVEKVISLRKDPTLKQRYVQLKQKIDQKDALAKQALTSDTNRLAAEEYGIKPRPTTVEPKPEPEPELEQRLAPTAPMAPKAPAAPAATDPYKDFSFEQEKMPDKDKYVADYLKDVDVYEKAHGIGKSDDALIQYLKDSEGEEQKNAAYNKNMALAKFGFQLASTPGSFITALGKSGVGFAEDMMTLNAQHNAALRQNKLAMLQAQAAKEKGDETKYREAYADYIATKNRIQTHNERMADLALNAAHYAEQNKLSRDQIGLGYAQLADLSRYRKDTVASANAYKAAVLSQNERKLLSASLDKDTTYQALMAKLGDRKNPPTPTQAADLHRQLDDIKQQHINNLKQFSSAGGVSDLDYGEDEDLFGTGG